MKYSLFLFVRWIGEIRSTGRGEALHRGLVPGHGAGHGRVQDQAERHPGAVQGGHQADVRLLSPRPTSLGLITQPDPRDRDMVPLASPYHDRLSIVYQ